MILPDSCVWIDHFRHGSAALAALLEDNAVLCHPFVIGELACGYLPARTAALSLLQTLPEAPMMQHEEVLALLERHRLMLSGIGWLDAHLLGSALLAGAQLWTRDRSLARATTRLGILASL